MTKLEFLKSYISDDIIKKKNILSEEEIINFQWNASKEAPLIHVLKLIIDEIEEGRSNRIIVRKVNMYLDNNL